MSTVIGIAGSLRKASFNASLLRAAQKHAPAEMRIEIASIAGFPLYDGDLEAEGGLPPAVSELKERIAAADGLLLVTPEYNHGIPGVFKNAIDWMSRPGKDIPRVFGNKPVGLMGASPGRGGTQLAQLAWLPTLRMFGARVWFGKQLQVAEATKVFASDGELADETVRERLVEFMSGFANFVAR